jgi:hypothetical protein
MPSSKQPNPPANPPSTPNTPQPPSQPPGGSPAQPSPQRAKLRIKGRWVEVEVKDRISKAGFDWVMYIDDDGLETWQVT